MKYIADLPSCAEARWIGDYGTYRIPHKFNNVRLRKDGGADRRFKRTREMEAHMRQVDKDNA